MRRAGMVVVVAFVLWTVGAIGLDTWGKTRVSMGPYDAIVVAGCRVYPNGRPSPALAWRIRKAVELYEAGVAPRIVFTGGLGTYPPTEAEASAAYAEELGVPRAAMVLEGRSTSTEENAANAAKSIHAKRIIVVTDAYHVFRARRVFDRYFDEVDAVGSTYGYWVRVRGAYREVLAVGKYAAFGDL